MLSLDVELLGYAGWNVELLGHVRWNSGLAESLVWGFKMWVYILSGTSAIDQG